MPSTRSHRRETTRSGDGPASGTSAHQRAPGTHLPIATKVLVALNSILEQIGPPKWQEKVHESTWRRWRAGETAPNPASLTVVAGPIWDDFHAREGSTVWAAAIARIAELVPSASREPWAVSGTNQSTDGHRHLFSEWLCKLALEPPGDPADPCEVRIPPPVPISEGCESVMRWMRRHWKRLPISDKLTEPLPLAATLRAEGKELKFSLASAAMLSAISAPSKAIVVLEGDAGGGKTTVLRWTAFLLAQKAASQSNAPLPIYFDLGRIGPEHALGSFQELLEKQLNSPTPVDYRPFLGSNRQIVCLLDGADLIADGRVLQKLLDEVAEQQDVSIVLSSRPDPRITQFLRDVPTAQLIRLQTLDKLAREQWLKSFTSDEAREQYRTIVSQNPHLETWLNVPLLFAMTASVCMGDQPELSFRTDQYPGRPGVFAGFVEYMVNRACVDPSRISKSDLDRFQEVHDIFDKVCLASATAGYVDRIPAPLANRILTEAGDSSRLSDWRHCLKVLRDAGLLTYDSRERAYTFIHQLFAEFFAARAFAHELHHARKTDSFEAVAFPVLENKRHDAISAQAMAILGCIDSSETVMVLFHAVSAASISGACSLLAAGGASTAAIILDPLVRGDSQINSIERMGVIDAAGNIPSEIMVRSLTAVATNPSENKSLRISAILALGRLQIPEAHVELCAIAKGDHVPLTFKVHALAQGAALLPSMARHLLIEAAKSTEIDPQTRQASIEAMLERLGDEALPIVSDLARNCPDFSVRLFASSKLGRIGTALEGPNLLHDSNPVTPPKELNPLSQGTHPAAVPPPTVGCSEVNGRLDPKRLDELLEDLELGLANIAAHGEAVTTLLALCTSENWWRQVDVRARVCGVSLEQRGTFAQRCGRRVLSPSFEGTAIAQLARTSVLREDCTAGDAGLLHIPNETLVFVFVKYLLGQENLSSVSSEKHFCIAMDHQMLSIQIANSGVSVVSQSTPTYCFLTALDCRRLVDQNARWMTSAK